MPTDWPSDPRRERSLRPSGELALDPSGEGVAIDETRKLIASNKVEGTEVFDPSGQALGIIHNFMVDKVTGQVAYAVMSFGGFLGLGESYHPLPWKSLTYEPRLGGYVVDIDRDRLADAPRIDDQADPLADPDFAARVDGFYRPARGA